MVGGMQIRLLSELLLGFQQVVLTTLYLPILRGSLFRRQSRKYGRLLKCYLGFLYQLVIDHFRLDSFG